MTTTSIVGVTVRVRVAEEAERAGLRRRLAVLAALDAPGLAPLRGIAEDGDGFEVTYEVPEGALPWTAVRGCAEPGHVVAMGLAAVQGLAALAEVGAEHGAIDAAAIHLVPDGSVLLVGAGLRAGMGDVAALAAVLAEGLRVAPPGLAARVAAAGRLEQLATALEDGVDPEPLADLVPASPDYAARPAPTRPGGAPAVSPGPSATATAGPSAARGRLALLAAGGALGVALIVSGAQGLLTGSDDPQATGVDSTAGPLARDPIGTAPRPEASPARSDDSQEEVPAEPDWRALVGSLDARRAAALAVGSDRDLTAVDDPAGPAYARDRAILRGLAGRSVRGGGTTVVSVREIERESTDGRVVLAIVDRRAAYRVLDAAGRVESRVPARGEARWEVTLTPYADTWRVWSAVGG